MSAAPSRSTDAAVLFVLLATVLLAFKGVFAKFAFTEGLSVEALLLVRFGVAAPLFWLAAGLHSGAGRPLAASDWRDGALAGGFFFFATYCDFQAIALIDVGLARLVLFTFPALVVLFTAVKARRAPSRRQLATFAVTYAGLLLVVAPSGPDGLAPGVAEGVAWALGSAVCYALYLMVSQGLTRRIGTVRFTALSGGVTLVLMLPMAVLAEAPIAFSASGLGWGLMIAVACTVVPFFLLLEGVRRCGAAQASLVALAGPAAAALAGWWLLDETLGPVQLVGFAITLAGVASLEGVAGGLARRAAGILGRRRPGWAAGD